MSGCLTAPWRGQVAPIPRSLVDAHFRLLFASLHKSMNQDIFLSNILFHYLVASEDVRGVVLRQTHALASCLHEQHLPSNFNITFGQTHTSFSPFASFSSNRKSRTLKSVVFAFRFFYLKSRCPSILEPRITSLAVSGSLRQLTNLVSTLIKGHGYQRKWNLPSGLVF